MTAVPANLDITNAATQSALQTSLEALPSVEVELPGGGPEVATTLSANTFQPADRSGVHRRIDTSGAAQTLYSIDPTHCRDGHVLRLSPSSTSFSLTIGDQHGGTGQMKTADSASVVMTDPRQWIEFKYNSATASWDETFRSGNIDAFPIAGVGSYKVLSAPSDGTTGKPSFVAMVAGHLQALLDFIAGWKARGSALSVSSNEITPVQYDCVVDTSGGAQTINSIDVGAGSANPIDGAEIRITISGSNALTITNNAGGATNPVLTNDGLDVTITSSSQYLKLQRVGSQWKEVGRVGFQDVAPAPIIVEGRLTAWSGHPADIAASGGVTLYFSPYKGNRVTTYNGHRWNTGRFSELSLTLSSMGIQPGQLANIFLVDPIVSGSYQLEAEIWQNSAISNNLTAGTGVVVNTTDTTNINVGDIVCVSQGTTTLTYFGELARVTAVNAGVSVTVDKLIYNYATTQSPKLCRSTMATSLTALDGAYVKSSDNRRLFLGTIMPTLGGGLSGTGQGAPSVGSVVNEYLTNGHFTSQQVGIWNYFNRLRPELYSASQQGNWTATAGSWTVPAGTNYQQYVWSFPIGVVEDAVEARYYQNGLISASGGSMAAGITTQVNPSNSSAVSPNYWTCTTSTASQRGTGAAAYRWRPQVGYNVVAALDHAFTNNCTVMGGDATYGHSPFVLDLPC